MGLQVVTSSPKRVSPQRFGLSRLTGLGWPRLSATVAVVVAHMMLGHPDYDLRELFLGGVCGAIALNVLWSYYERRTRGLPVLEWVVLQFYVFFAMPVFSEGTSLRSESFLALSRAGAIRHALVATILFLVFVLAGWLAIPRRRDPLPGPTESGRRVPIPLIVVYGVLSLVVSFALRQYEIELRGAWYTHVLAVFFLPATAQILLLFEVTRRPRARDVRACLLAFTSGMVLLGLLSSRLEHALVPILTLGIGILGRGERLPKRLVLVVLLFFIILNPAKYVYRQLTGYRTSEFSSQTVGEMVDAWVQSVTEVWVGDNDLENQGLKTTAERLDSLSATALVVYWCPKRVPYARGDPWLVIPYSLVPRFLWPGKPDMTHISNDRFAVLFGLMTQADTKRTTYEYPAIADGFWNFGWFGVAFAGLLAGLLWKIVRHVWSPTNRYRYVLPFYFLVSTQASAAVPKLLVGIPQIVLAGAVVVGSLELIGSLFQPPEQKRRRLL